MAEQSKAAVADHLAKAGKHDTSVHETIAPSVVQERVQPTRHEHVTTAVEREVHQDHYHTSVQPIVDKQTLPEQHTHNVAPTEQRNFVQKDPRDAELVTAQAAQFKDHRTVAPTEHSHTVQPKLEGHHVHHHIHETIQPVVQRETIQPNVVHTVVPVHEVHQNASEHHATSALPAVSMADFKASGGSLTGREERTDAFTGEPKAIGGSHGTTVDPANKS